MLRRDTIEHAEVRETHRVTPRASLKNDVCDKDTAGDYEQPQSDGLGERDSEHLSPPGSNNRRSLVVGLCGRGRGPPDVGLVDRLVVRRGPSRRHGSETDV